MGGEGSGEKPLVLGGDGVNASGPVLSARFLCCPESASRAKFTCVVGLKGNMLYFVHFHFLNFSFQIYAFKSKLFSHMVLVAHCQTLCFCAFNSSFPGRLLADAVNSSPFSRSPHTACTDHCVCWCSCVKGKGTAAKRVTPGGLSFLSPWRRQSWSVWPCDLFPLPFLILVWQESPLAPVQNTKPRLMGRGGKGGSNLRECGHLSSCVYTAGNQNVLFGSKICFLLSA